MEASLALGLAYLAFLWPSATYIATIIVFTFGAVGVVLALLGLSVSRRLDFGLEAPLILCRQPDDPIRLGS